MLTILSVILLANGLQASTPQNEEKHFLDRIKSIETGASSADVKQLISDIRANWNSSKDEHYFRVIVELCTALNSTVSKDSSRASTVRLLAMETLDEAGDKPLHVEIKLILFLQSDPDYATGKLRDTDWTQARIGRVVRWLRVLDHLKKADASLPKVVQPPRSISVEPPVGANILPGMPASMIKDPALKKQYEDAIASNVAEYRMYRRKDDVQRLTRLFVSPAIRYITEAYSKPPYNTPELEQLLSSFAVEADARAEILKEVKRRVHDHPAATEPPKGSAIPSPDIKGETNAAKSTTGSPIALKSDRRLQLKISEDFKEPTLKQILSVISSRTNVAISTEQDGEQKAIYSSLNWNAVEAWMVMEQIAKAQMVDGHWEQAGDGYRLVRNANTTKTQEPNRFPESKPETALPEPATPPASTSRTKILIAVNLAIFAAIATGLLIRYFKRRTP